MAEFNKEKVIKLIGEIQQAREELGRFEKMSIDEFILSRDNYAIGEHYLRRALEGILSISTHLVSRLPGGVKSKDYTEVIVTLGDFEVIPKEFAARIRGMAGYRNRLVHLYWNVTPKELYEKISGELKDIDMFVDYIIQYLRKIGKDT